MIGIRPYRAEDRAACKAIYYRAVREGARPAYTQAQLALWAPSPEVDHSQPDRMLEQWAYVATLDGRLTGFMSMTPEGYLDLAFVLPEVRGLGHAAALYDRLLARAHQARLPRLNVHASRLFRPFLLRRGWQVDAVEQHPVGNERLERFVMSLHLPAEAGPAPVPG